jgi:cell division protein FtsN
MEFLRRNWVDLLMALLIAAVIAAVLFLLLSGGKLFKPASNTVTSTPVNVSKPVVTPPSNTTKPNSPEIPANTNKPTQVVAAKPTTSSNTTKPAVKPVIKPTSKPNNKPLNTKTINVPEIPALVSSTKPASVQKPSTTNIKPKTTTATISTPVKQTQKVIPPATTTSKPSTTIKPRATKTTAPNTQTKPITTSAKPSSRTSYLSSYRIVVASYKTQPRAETFAAQVRSQGFPARAVLSQGLYLVIVGPYSGQSNAENVFKRLKNTYPGATLYRPNGSRSGSSTRKPSTPRKIFEGSSSKPATLNSTLAKKPIQSSMTTTKNLVVKNENNPKIETAYLQVGAFKNAASASPLLINLRKAGYTAKLRVSSNGVTRVIIGPLTGTPLELARADLRSRGLQPFTLR